MPTPSLPSTFPSAQQATSPVIIERKFIAQTIKEHAVTIWQKISRTVQIIFQTILSAFLYWFNPSLFAGGFIIGIVRDEEVIPALKKIKDIWIAQPWCVCVLGGIAGTISLPVALGASSFLWGSYLGSMLSTYSQKVVSLKYSSSNSESLPADDTSERIPVVAGG